MAVNFVGFGLNVLQRLKVGRVRREAPECLDLNECLCLPLTPLPSSKLSLRGGIFLDDGSYIQASGLVTNGRVVVGAGEGLLLSPQKSLPGRSLYLGICHYHYGHFLIETLSRLWCFSRGELSAFDHILLLPISGHHVPAFVYDLFRLLGVSEKICEVNEPLKLESVSIPAPAIVYPGRVHYHVAEISTLFKGCCSEQETDQPLFISRTALAPGHNRVIIGEDWVERLLVAQGVRVFHPERHSVNEQIVTCSRHRTIIGFAGSALHTIIMARGNRRIFAYSSRQVPHVFPLLDQALNNQTNYIRARREVLPGLAQISTAFSPQLVDPRIILSTLRVEGVIGRYDLEDYGSKDADAAEVCRFNTALLLRRLLEVSQAEGDSACFEEIRKFKEMHSLDPAMLASGSKESALLRRFFPL